MNYADAKDGDYIRFARHDGTRSGGPAKPVFRLRAAIRFVHDDDGICTGSREEGLERVVVVPFPPYAKGKVLPFTETNADQFVPASMPLAAVPAAAKRSNRSGSRRSR